jgi:NRPS condensation-like uncharacterized protein
MNTNTIRKMGALEKLGTIIHDELHGSTSVAAMIKVNQVLDFEEFKEAWRIMFERQPMLRALHRIEGDTYYLDFNADFNEVPLQFIDTDDIATVTNEYDNEVAKFFSLSKYVWRSTLINMPKSQTAYILFGAPHSICDGRSISWLLGDLLRVILELRHGQQPDRTSYPITQPVDEILDHDWFAKPLETDKPDFKPLTFVEKTTCEQSLSKNILYAMKPEQFRRFHAACRKESVTINSALCAALTLAVAECVPKHSDVVEMGVGFSQRPYTVNNIHDRVYAFYAHRFAMYFKAKDIDFWELAREAQQACRDGIKHYQLPDINNKAFFTDLKNLVHDNFDKQQFFAPYTVTNVGVVDEAFEGCEELGANDFYFTATNKGVFGICLFAGTLNDKLCLDFSYSEPGLPGETAHQIMDACIQQLLDKI